MSSPSSEIYLFIASGTILLTGLISFIIYFVVIYRKKQLLHDKEKQILQSTFNQAILQAQLEIQEQTLKNISQEIHDNIGQALTLAKLNLNTMLPQANDQLQEKIINSKELVSKAIGDLRDLSKSLDTDYVKEMGLQRAIEYELEMMQKTGIIKTNLVVEGSVLRLSKQNELILFRIIQETFHNIIKHAQAQVLHVNVWYTPGHLQILIADNGKGMDLTPLNAESNSSFGLGIRNMHSRAKLIGAEFSMSSTLGKGTEVKITLPLENTNHESNS